MCGSLGECRDDNLSSVKMICQGNTGQMHREIRQDAGLAHWSRTCGKEWREFRKGGSTFLFHRDNQKRFEED